MFIQYQQVKLPDWKLAMIEQANAIIDAYADKGYSLTLRQLYYQFVSRDILPAHWANAETGSTNNERSYKNLGELINTGRLGGLVSWEAIVDRTRELTSNSHWATPNDIMRGAAQSYAVDKWANQPYRVEAWVEKDALEDVVGRAAEELDISYFSCRGYTSQTAMHEAARRLENYIANGQRVLLLHLGDHDPSGIDMSRDIEDRLNLFLGPAAADLEVRRIALTMQQIRRYGPPPNPAKITDCRAAGYIERYGKSSWELDALDPEVITDLITAEVLDVRDEERWVELADPEARDKELLAKASKNWADVVQLLNDI